MRAERGFNKLSFRKKALIVGAVGAMAIFGGCAGLTRGDLLDEGYKVTTSSPAPDHPLTVTDLPVDPKSELPN